MSYGFVDGKNKITVYSKDEADTELSYKQDQHSTQTATLLAADWNNKAQTINVTGVTASNTVLVSPVPASIKLYGASGIVCSAQGAGTLTFTCDDTPLSNIAINVLIFGV